MCDVLILPCIHVLYSALSSQQRKPSSIEFLPRLGDRAISETGISFKRRRSSLVGRVYCSRLLLPPTIPTRPVPDCNFVYVYVWCNNITGLADETLVRSKYRLV